MEHFEELLNKNPKLFLVGKHFFKIALILAASYFAVKAIRFFSGQILKYAEKKASGSEERHRKDYEKRLETIVKLIDTTARVVLFGFAFLMVLKEMGFDITPLLTGAGIAGVAVGFGAQSLVKDVISGFFILIENQIRIADSVSINGTNGVVESLDLRTITLRDSDATIHIIPNGEIKTVSNHSYGYSIALVDIPVSYKIEIGKIISVIEKTVRSFESDSRFNHQLLSSPQFLGISSFNPQFMQMRLSVRTRCSDKGFIEKELRKKILEDLQGEKLEIGISSSCPT